jgi:drug/metabolite transporter (DMT)-like permease
MILSWLGLFITVVTPGFGQVYYKLYFRTRKLSHLILSIAIFLTAPVGSYLALRHLSLGLVSMSTAITQIIVLVLARYLLKEEITRAHVAAMLVITAGVVIFALP